MEALAAFIFRVVVELFFIQTVQLVLRPFNVVVVPSNSLLPLQRQPSGRMGIQEWAALILGMMIWGLIAIMLVGLLRRQ